MLAVALLAGAALGCSKRQSPPFSAETAWTHLVRQCELGPRVPGTQGHAAAMRYIVEQLQAHGATVQLQRFEIADPYSDDTLPLSNIIGSFHPERKRRVLLAAHYDTRPWADEEEVDSLKTMPIIGANDSASGVAVLLEVGRLVSEHPPHDLGVDVVFFDGEDYGKQNDLDYYLLGSKYFAANLAGYRPLCGILLDMVGAKNGKIRQEGNSLMAAPRLTTDLFARAARLNLDVFVAERGQPILDDHVPLLRAGIPMVDLIGLPWEHWHTLGDTPDACSPETLHQVGTLLLDFIYDFTFER